MLYSCIGPTRGSRPANPPGFRWRPQLPTWTRYPGHAGNHQCVASSHSLRSSEVVMVNRSRSRRGGHVLASDLSREQRHAFVRGELPRELGDSEGTEVGGRQELRCDYGVVERRIGGEVRDGTAVATKRTKRRLPCPGPRPGRAASAALRNCGNGELDGVVVAATQRIPATASLTTALERRSECREAMARSKCPGPNTGSRGSRRSAAVWLSHPRPPTWHGRCVWCTARGEGHAQGTDPGRRDELRRPYRRRVRTGSTTCGLRLPPTS